MKVFHRLSFVFSFPELLDALLCRNGSAAESEEQNAGASGSETTANGHTPGAAAASNGEHIRNRHKHTSASEKSYTPEQAESVKRSVPQGTLM